MQSKRLLLEIVNTLCTTGRLSGGLNGRQQQANQDANNGNYY
jgi:hypothetical protein